MMRFKRTPPSGPPGSAPSQSLTAAAAGNAPSVLKVFLDQREVTIATTLSRTALYEAMKHDFPAPVRLSPTGRRVAWRAAEVLAWCESRVAAGAALPESAGAAA